MISTAKLLLKRELGLGDRLGGGLTRPAEWWQGRVTATAPPGEGRVVKGGCRDTGMGPPAQQGGVLLCRCDCIWTVRVAGGEDRKGGGGAL